MGITVPLAALTSVVLTFSGVGCSGPPREACGPSGPQRSIASICGFRNPEDIDFDASTGVVIVSNMRHSGSLEGGSLSAMAADGTGVRTIWPRGDSSDFLEESHAAAATENGCPGRPNRGVFRPHGITFAHRGDQTFLYVVAHESDEGGREAVEIFALNGSGANARLQWSGCIPTPEGTHGNDVAVAPDGMVIVSNWMEVISLWSTIKGAVFHARTGDILAYRGGEGWSRLRGTDAAMPNGVAVSPDGSMLFYSETGTGKIYRRPFDESAPSVFVEVGGNPDNLSWTDHGTLLVATHTGGPAFSACEFGRLPCKSPWEVYEIDPVTLASTLVLAHNGDAVGAIATATQVKDRIYLGSVFDDRLGYAALRRK